MDFLAFQAAIAKSQCSKWTPRQKRLEAYSRALHGKLYAHLTSAFSKEKSGNAWSGDRVLLDDRRAAVQDRLPMELVRDQAGMLFGESHRPVVVARDDDPTSDWIQAFIADTKFWLVLTRVLWSSSIGSGCVVLRVLGEQETDAAGGFVPKGKGAYHFEIWPTYQCKPVFKRTAPSVLDTLERVWFVGSDTLAADGYDVEALMAEWSIKKLARRGTSKSTTSILANGTDEWAIRLTLDQNEEQWFKPAPRWIYERADWDDKKDWKRDPDRSMTHALGEVPAIWVRPLPLDDDALFPDGLAMIDPVIDFQFRIDRTLSQVGRAFDYAGDPQMVRIMAKATGGGTFGNLDEELSIGGTAADVVDVGPGGDAKFIEARGDALAVAIEVYVKTLRDAARESGAMSRITPDGNARTELSAVAMKMLNFSQLVMSGILRTTVGEEVGIGLLRMAMRMWSKVEVALPSYEKSAPPKADARIDLAWPDYYELTGLDKLNEVQANAGAIEAGLVSQETAVGNIAPLFDVQDATDELKRIEAEQAESDARDLDLADSQAAIAAKHAPPSASGGGKSGA